MPPNGARIVVWAISRRNRFEFGPSGLEFRVGLIDEPLRLIALLAQAVRPFIGALPLAYQRLGLLQPDRPIRHVDPHQDILGPHAPAFDGDDLGDPPGGLGPPLRAMESEAKARSPG